MSFPCPLSPDIFLSNSCFNALNFGVLGSRYIYHKIAQFIDQKHMESFEMWCWRRIEKISWTDHVRNEEVLLRVKEQRNILHEISKRKAKWIGHILRRNCFLQRVIEGNIQGGIEVTGRRGRRRRKPLDDLNPLNPELNPI